MYYLIADTHMGHKNICKYCNRPVGFEDIVMRRWQEMVKEEDVVIHLGDLSFEEEWVNRMGKLPGRKILIIGNHDRLTTEAYLSAGWMPMQMLVLKLQGMRISFSHHPLWGHSNDLNIHGHEHDLHILDDTRLYFPIALEHTNYAPLAMTENMLKEIRSFVAKNRQPSPKEIHKMLKSERPLGSRDFYGSFGKAAYEKSQEKLRYGYKLLSHPDVVRAAQGYQFWQLVREHVEGKMDADTLKQRVRILSQKK